MTQESGSTARYTEKRAKVYDNLIRQVVPGYEVLHDLTTLVLRQELANDAHILTVGAGTGHEIECLCNVDETWRFTGVEPASEMAKAAQERINYAKLEQRVELVKGFVYDLPEGPQFDAATMMLVMHFVADDGGKADLLKSICSRLKPGAPLIFADLNGERGSPRFEKFSELWRSWQLHAGMPEHQVDKGFRTMIKDIHFVPVERTLALLYEAGFEAPEPFFSGLMFGGWIAKRKA
ncbi:MAG: class I SAM-dependent methyltransferase [Rhodospirillales bacterium]|nr:class I SAM-dependent methyltransferase [Rhodospirillales bacterium]